MPFKQNVTLNKNRYRLYREHKYIFFVFSEILRLAASLDFSVKGSIKRLKDELSNLSLLLQSHAEYEESRIHLILKNKNSPLFHKAEEQHLHQKDHLEQIEKKINLIEIATTPKEIHFLGYEIYLDLRIFFSENLNHFDYEERVIMPELQRLISDNGIKEIDRISYRKMLPEQMIHMIKVLFPHMNSDDKFIFLSEIKICEPQKFELAWSGIFPMIEESEKINLMKSLSLIAPDKRQ